MKRERERRPDTGRECKHSETLQSQVPGQSIKRPRLYTPQSTPHNPAHGLHTVHTLLFLSCKQSTHTQNSYTPPRECRLHYTTRCEAGYGTSPKQVAFVFTAQHWVVQRQKVQQQFCGLSPAAALKTSSTSHKTQRCKKARNVLQNERLFFSSP